ncbi:hypothetical protein ISCGN_029144, partial [Ixodes scapularis]
CHSLVDCASRDEASWEDAVIALNRRGLPSDASAAFRLAAGRLRSRLVLLRWLRAHYAEQTTTDAVTAPTPPPPPPPLAARYDGDKEARVPSSSSPTTQPKCNSKVCTHLLPSLLDSPELVAFGIATSFGTYPDPAARSD